MFTWSSSVASLKRRFQPVDPPQQLPFACNLQARRFLARHEHFPASPFSRLDHNQLHPFDRREQPGLLAGALYRSVRPVGAASRHRVHELRIAYHKVFCVAAPQPPQLFDASNSQTPPPALHTRTPPTGPRGSWSFSGRLEPLRRLPRCIACCTSPVGVAVWTYS